MGDISWFSALAKSGGGGGGSSDYDQLSNKPVININGTGIVITSLSTGVYNIEGTWKITEDDDERSTFKDDLFYVLNDGEQTKLTWISAGTIKTYSAQNDGTKEEIVEDSIATSSEVIARMVGVF